MSLPVRLQYDQMTPDAQMEFIDTLRTKQRDGSLSDAERDVLVSYFWHQRLVEPVESIQYIFDTALLTLVHQEHHLIEQLLEYLYVVGTQNTKKQEDRVAVQSAYAMLKKACIESVTVFDPNTIPIITQKSLIVDYTHITQKTQDSIELANWMTKVQQIMEVHGTRMGDTDITATELYDKTMLLRELFDFFLGVADSKIYPLVLQHRFPDMFDSESSVEEDQTVVPQVESVEETIVPDYRSIQAQVVAEFGDLRTLAPADIAPVLSYLSQQAEVLADPTITELIYFDTATSTFVWNEDLLNQS